MTSLSDGICLPSYSQRWSMLLTAIMHSTTRTVSNVCLFESMHSHHASFIYSPQKATPLHSPIIYLVEFHCSHKTMERNSFLKVVKTLRYNSPSKRQIRRQTGRPKYLNQKVAEPVAVAPEPIKYTKKEVAPFAVRLNVGIDRTGDANKAGEAASRLLGYQPHPIPNP